MGWILLLVAVFAAAYFAYERSKRRSALAMPFPEERIVWLREDLPPYSQLSDAQRDDLHGYIQEFLYDKHFEGCGGLDLTARMKVLVAAQACLLLLNRDVRCYPKLRSVLLYPATFTGGHNHQQGRLGESWGTGLVVLAWNSVRGGAQNFGDGRNVTMHEFAHQLDQADGRADGRPETLEPAAYASWARVLQVEYRRLRARSKRGRKTVMDRYGATHPAEFFAVATETFFEKPKQLARKRPDLFEELKGFYKIDPRTW